MQWDFLERVNTQSQAALTNGDLLPVQAQETTVTERGIVFFVRWVSSLAAKDASKQSIPGGPRDPNFNPFLPPDPALTVGDYFKTHNTVLNKFALSEQHIVLADKQFSEQLAPLNIDDFYVLAQVLHAYGGLGFYNGGPDGGASQRHKHVQWMPSRPDNPSLGIYLDGLPPQAQSAEQHRHAELGFEHLFVRLPYIDSAWPEADELAPAMLQAHQTACVVLGLRPDEHGLLPGHNMLVGQGWMLIIPRSQEMAHGISINALSFGGCIYVREPEQIELVKTHGPLEILAMTAVRL